ncbi:hypothetical protein SAMN02745127_01869 [Oceanospirillum multiglobuliferum]|uniref:Uncharacterized protein n=1 Tax=Oceanospirillum multiglobuliferum TaxID=64969 RepID=A0A1T4QDZ0_9GAMM|nr:hypothetical protein [Oceanospirillum multiglobuliferum]OPX56496.1 hypothetical protein BTE48_03460 [Oceanospirillum multiglobuliferum]SKA01915.1 hypothetical protein SAMN02745127_01869 [Oceanospirillum multiglobuliferum]
MSTIPTEYYGLNRWFTLAQGDEALLVRILADTAGLKGWLPRPLHDQLNGADLKVVLASEGCAGFETAAVYLLSQMPLFKGPETEQEWQYWLIQWAIIYKQKTPAEQIDLLPERFQRAQAELVLQQLNQNKAHLEIPITALD